MRLMQIFFARLLIVLALAFSLGPASTWASELELFMRSPQFTSPVLSRSGKFLAAAVPHRDRMNLAVIDLDSRKASLLTSFEDFDVVDINWVGDQRIVFSLGQFNSPTGPGNFDGGGLFVIDKDGGNSKRLSSTVRELIAQRQNVLRQLSFYRTIPDSTDEIVAIGNMNSADAQDLYRLNLNTGRYQLLTSGRPTDLTVRWIVDDQLIPRVATSSVRDEIAQVVHYRADAASPWIEIARFSRDKGEVFVPLSLNRSGTLQVATNRGRDTMAVFEYDPKSQKLGELIASHPRFDMGADSQGSRIAGPIFGGEPRKLLGYGVNADLPEAVWVDADYARVQATLDKAIPGQINQFSRSPDGKRWLVRSFSSTSSMRWYLLDDEKNSLEEIGSATPWLDGKLVEQRPMRYKTRDGLEIPGYLFLPKNFKDGSRLPLVVHIHGGPTARADTYGSGWGVLEAQILASQGYATLVPNFRITPGFGQKIYSAGFGTIGRQMSEDHEDAAKWAVDQGYADPRRMCISGASYGGYAALQAMVKTPGLFKCAIAGLAVTDLVFQNTSLETDYVRYKQNTDFWKAIIGTDDLKSKLAFDISPVNHAEKIKGAVFLYAGRDDRRVPIDQINRMEKALRAANNPAKAFVVKDREGHGFGKKENRLDLYQQILKFLEEQFK